VNIRREALEWPRVCSCFSLSPPTPPQSTSQLVRSTSARRALLPPHGMKQRIEIPAFEKNNGTLYKDALQESNFECFIILNS
jgi:hypothetical protein